MFYKIRTESIELQIYQSLFGRKELSEKEKQTFNGLKKGLEGERLFDSFVEKYERNCYILNDLLFQSNNHTFQIDSLIITSKKIYIFEVKNFEGDYYYESDKIFTKSKIEIMNPLIQLNRIETLLRQLLQRNGFSYPIISKVVFVNPEFTLYQAPMNSQFIFPNQIHRFLREMNFDHSKVDSNDKQLVDKLMSLHLSESPYSNVPNFEYEQLKKGITCAKCQSLFVAVKGRKCVCSNCNNAESFDAAILRSTKEFKTLFPNKKLTTNIIFDWCKIINSKKTVRRVLEKNYSISGKNRWKYFE